METKNKMAYLSKQSKSGFDKTLGQEKLSFDKIVQDIENFEVLANTVFFTEDAINFLEEDHFFFIFGQKYSSKKYLFSIFLE